MISTLVTKFSQNIVADTDKNKALTDCYKCSSSFLSLVKSHPLKIPASVLEKVRGGGCLKLFLIDCKCGATRAREIWRYFETRSCILDRLEVRRNFECAP